jgi:hypothetical protein
MKKFQLVNVFEDDHESCCNFTYDGRKFSLWWAAVAAIAAFEYDDSARAQAILKPISEVLEMMIANENDTFCKEDTDYRHTDWGFFDYGWNRYSR